MFLLHIIYFYLFDIYINDILSKFLHAIALSQKLFTNIFHAILQSRQCVKPANLLFGNKILHIFIWKKKKQNWQIINFMIKNNFF